MLIVPLLLVTACRSSRPTSEQSYKASYEAPTDQEHAFIHGEFLAIVTDDGSVFLELEGSRYPISGPDLRLSPRALYAQQVMATFAIVRLHESADELASFLERQLEKGGEGARLFRPLVDSWLQQGELVFIAIGPNAYRIPVTIRLSEQWERRLQESRS